MENVLPFCRVCLQTSLAYADLESQLIVSCSGKPRITYLEAFRFCTRLEIAISDSLPKSLCLDCGRCLKTAYEFIKKARTADLILRDTLAEGECIKEECTSELEVGSESENCMQDKRVCTGSLGRHDQALSNDCPVCGKKFMSKLVLNMHVKRAHATGSESKLGASEQDFEVAEPTTKEIDPCIWEPTCEAIIEPEVSESIASDQRILHLPICSTEVTPTAVYLPENSFLMDQTQTDLLIRDLESFTPSFIDGEIFYGSLGNHVAREHTSPECVKNQTATDDAMYFQGSVSNEAIKRVDSSNQNALISASKRICVGDDGGVYYASLEPLEETNREVTQCTDDLKETNLPEVIDECEDLLIEICHQDSCPEPVGLLPHETEAQSVLLQTEESEPIHDEKEEPIDEPNANSTIEQIENAENSEAVNVFVIMRPPNLNEVNENEPQQQISRDIEVIKTNRESKSTETTTENQRDKSVKKNGFPCEVCGEYLRDKIRLEGHLNKHKGVKSFTCEPCGLSYASKYGLYSHIHRVHRNNKKQPSECKVCGKMVVRLKEHMETHKPNVNRKKVSCSICQKLLAKEALRMHMKRAHGNQIFLCCKCPKQFTCEANLRKHQATHAESRQRCFECHICNKKFFSKSLLHMHGRTHSDAIFSCEVCGKKFYRKAGLLLHMKKHSGNTVQCNICAKGFVSNSELKVHMRFHNNDYAFECEVCHQRFCVKSALNYHMRNHLGITFKCNVCFKEFSHPSAFKIHTYRHFGKPYPCQREGCVKAFLNKKLLERHMEEIHKTALTNEDLKAIHAKHQMRSRSLDNPKPLDFTFDLDESFNIEELGSFLTETDLNSVP